MYEFQNVAITLHSLPTPELKFCKEERWCMAETCFHTYKTRYSVFVSVGGQTTDTGCGGFG